MPSLKKGILYSILFFIIIWMFVLGIFVGRGSAPVKFDTREFQKKLANIAGKQDAENSNLQDTEIQFYEDLQTPMSEAADMPEKQDSVTRSIDKPVESENPEVIVESDKNIPIKLSRKSLTKAKYIAELEKSASVKKKVSKANASPKIISEKKDKNKYTIQVAAFKDMQSAVNKISSLKTKGHNAYRALGKVRDEIWYRVRIGHFSNTEVARKYLRKLKLDNINGIIIKQDS